jgi:hypothetical protein
MQIVWTSTNHVKPLMDNLLIMHGSPFARNMGREPVTYARFLGLFELSARCIPPPTVYLFLISSGLRIFTRQ